MMTTKPNISPERLAELRSEGQRLRPILESEMSSVRAEWKQWASSVTSVVARHSKEIDDYILTHGPMTREEVVERALTKLLAES